MILLSRRGGLLGRLVARRLDALGLRTGILGATQEQAALVAPSAQGIPLEGGGSGAALAQSRALLLLSEGPDERPLDEEVVIEQAARARIRRVVRLSMHGADPFSDDPFLAHHGRGDTALGESGISHTILETHLFLQDLLLFAPSIRAGFPLIDPPHRPRIAYIDIRDVADAAVNVLQRPIHQGETQILTGPRAWDMQELSTAITDATGRPVPIEHTSDALGALQGIGLTPSRSRAVAAMLDAYGPREEATRTVSRLTGLPPRSMEVFLMDQRHRFADRPVGHAATHDEVRMLDHALSW